MQQDKTIAFLNSIGCEGLTADAAGLRFAEKVIAGERARIAAWIRARQPMSSLPGKIERGDHE